MKRDAKAILCRKSNSPSAAQRQNAIPDQFVDVIAMSCHASSVKIAVWLGAIGTGLLVSCRPAGQEAVQVSPLVINLRVLETVRPTSLQGGIPLPVDFQGGLFHFVLDTGASMSVFDETFRPLLGDAVGTEVVYLPGAKEPQLVHSYAAPDARIGQLSLKQGGPVLCMSMEAVRRKTGTKISGVIGMSFLKHYYLNMNFDEMVIKFCEEVDEQGRAIPKSGLPEDFRCPDIALMLATGEELFTLDTADDGIGGLREEVFDKLVDMGLMQMAASNRTAASAKEMIEAPLGIYQKPLFFCGMEHHQLTFMRNSPSRLGLGFITQYNLLCDFPKGGIQFLPRNKRQPAQPSPVPSREPLATPSQREQRP